MLVAALGVAHPHGALHAVGGHALGARGRRLLSGRHGLDPRRLGLGAGAVGLGTRRLGLSSGRTACADAVSARARARSRRMLATSSRRCFLGAGMRTSTGRSGSSANGSFQTVTTVEARRRIASARACAEARSMRRAFGDSPRSAVSACSIRSLSVATGASSRRDPGGAANAAVVVTPTHAIAANRPPSAPILRSRLCIRRDNLRRIIPMCVSGQYRNQVPCE